MRRAATSKRAMEPMDVVNVATDVTHDAPFRSAGRMEPDLYNDGARFGGFAGCGGYGAYEQYAGGASPAGFYQAEVDPRSGGYYSPEAEPFDMSFQPRRAGFDWPSPHAAQNDRLGGYDAGMDGMEMGERFAGYDGGYAASGAEVALDGAEAAAARLGGKRKKKVFRHATDYQTSMGTPVHRHASYARMPRHGGLADLAPAMEPLPIGEPRQAGAKPKKRKSTKPKPKSKPKPKPKPKRQPAKRKPAKRRRYGGVSPVSTMMETSDMGEPRQGGARSPRKPVYRHPTTYKTRSGTIVHRHGTHAALPKKHRGRKRGSPKRASPSRRKTVYHHPTDYRMPSGTMVHRRGSYAHLPKRGGLHPLAAAPSMEPEF